jgi:hypothetical protein
MMVPPSISPSTDDALPISPNQHSPRSAGLPILPNHSAVLDLHKPRGWPPATAHPHHPPRWAPTAGLVPVACRPTNWSRARDKRGSVEDASGTNSTSAVSGTLVVTAPSPPSVGSATFPSATPIVLSFVCTREIERRKRNGTCETDGWDPHVIVYVAFYFWSWLPNTHFGQLQLHPELAPPGVLEWSSFIRSWRHPK